jgi:hypothetical protein
MQLQRLQDLKKTVVTKFEERCKPAIPRRLLPAVAGVMWWSVGIMLTVMALKWLWFYDGNVWHYAIPGLIAALLIHHFGFLRIADRNIVRIAGLPARPCIFSFISWQSWLLVIVMITMGSVMRHSSIPREYLSVIYMGIGQALFLSGIRYFRASF